ncbi:band 4.1-like protein 3 [Zerene cesonia]|uniref:band 4.1-like protein 3 n=1 Tax=Zerene cesonia TaxID=33412 RepID=UPI0018E512E1|nr:band 4.1-like protein 3 [Zerene cesonia]
MRESLRRLASDDGTSMVMRRSNSGRVRVELLNGEHITVDVDRKANGADLLDKVCDNLDIVDKDFFGLLHAQRGDPRVWVDLKRRLSKTFRNEPWDVRLAVKFYHPEPSELQDDVTRYQLSLAVRRDLIEGRLTCSQITYALLASYVLQAELGDRAGPVSASALSACRAAPLCALGDTQRDNIEQLYAKHKGQTPAEAELNYLENAKRLPLYGAELHGAQDSEHVDIQIAVSASGIAVLRDGVIMNKFPWPKILKISYNKRIYTLRLRSSEFDEFETQVSFHLPSSRASKALWRCSVEHHMFFRRERATAVARVARLPRLGSRRLACRATLRQLRARRA